MKRFPKLLPLSALLLTLAYCSERQLSFFDASLVGSGSSAGLESHLKIGDRNYVRSVLENIYIYDPSTAATSPTRAILEANLGKDKINVFGGPCDIYQSQSNIALKSDYDSDACDGVGPTGTQASLLPVSTPSREGWRIAVCDQLAQSDAATLDAVNNVLGSSRYVARAAVPAPTLETLRNAYDLFHTAAPTAPDSALSKVLDVGHEAIRTAPAGTDKNFEGWRWALLTLCLDPTWQTQ